MKKRSIFNDMVAFRKKLQHRHRAFDGILKPFVYFLRVLRGENCLVLLRLILEHNAFKTISNLLHILLDRV
jgi:hypothetical protein